MYVLYKKEKDYADLKQHFQQKKELSVAREEAVANSLNNT